MARKVFYSWQSDRDEKAGRWFLRDALQRAIDELHAEIEFEVAERPELDHDTKGIAGSPGIADVILSKIRESAVFVADVTPIGKTDNGKSVINPNVAIELGYALKAVGDAGLVMIMNSKYGTRDDLPFDLKHRRGPILYELGDDADGLARTAAEKRIVPYLKEAIKQSLDNVQTPPAVDVVDRAAAVATIKSHHSERVTEVANGHAPVEMKDGSKMILHVVPFSTVNALPLDRFDEICGKPDDFPPIGSQYARDWRVDFDGLVIGSNSEGLTKPQRAYVRVSQTGAIEAVDAIATGNHAIELWKLRASIATYACRYARSLSFFGVKPPLAVFLSLVGVEGSRLLRQPIGSGFLEDTPYVRLDRDRYQFNVAIFDAVPKDAAESGKLLRPLLSHLDRTAGVLSAPD